MTNQIIDEAVNTHGIFWVNSTGNAAAGSHWGGQWSDPDGNNRHNFDGADESQNIDIAANALLLVSLRWNDGDNSWGGECADYDIEVYNNPELSGPPVGWANGWQNCLAADKPIENLRFVADRAATYYLVVKRAGGAGNHRLDLMVYSFHGFQHWTADHSLPIPADNSSGGMVSVGAVVRDGVGAFTELAAYSSRGPTMDGRVKPDLGGPSEITTASRPGGFGGTSAAAPHVAGLAALVKQENPGFTSVQIKDYLAFVAQRDRLTPAQANWPNNLFGHGRVNAGPVPAYPAAVMQDRPRAYWQLDERTWTRESGLANDASGNGLHGAIMAVDTLNQQGIFGLNGRTALYLNGSTSHVVAPSGFADFSGGLTVEAWVYPTAKTNWARIIDFGNGQGSDNILLARASTSTDLVFQVYNGTSAGSQVIAPGYLQLNRWQHVAATLDPAGNAAIYYNGRLVAAGTTAVPRNVARTRNYIGRSNWGADAYFQGSIDEVAIYPMALPADRIAAHYTAAGYALDPLPPTGDYWRGRYYATTLFEGDPVLTRDDGTGATLDFNWGSNAPDPAVPADGFAVRWERLVALNGECYTLWTRSDDGVRVFVNNRQVLSYWFDQGGTDRFDRLCPGSAAYPAAGTYPVRVDYYERTGPARLFVKLIPDRVEATAADGQARTVTFSSTDQGLVVRMPFAGTRNQRVSLNITNVSAATRNCCGTIVSIWRGTTTQLAAVDAGYTGDFLEPITLPDNDTYNIFVDPTGLVTGSLTLQLYDVPPDATADIPADGTPTTVVTTAPGQNARLRFFGTPGQRISLHVTSTTYPTSCIGAWFLTTAILNPDGTVLVPGFCTRPDSFVDTRTLNQEGFYTISIDPAGTRTGSITIRLYTVPPDATGTIPTDGTPTTIATTVPGQNANLTFSGTIGQRISLHVTGVTYPASCIGAWYLTTAILGPDGSATVPGFCTVNGSFVDTRVLPASGTYTITINPLNAGTGSITFRLYTVPPDATGTIPTDGTATTIATTVPGQNARLTFSGTSGQQLRLRVTGVTYPTSCIGAWFLTTSILNPDGTTLVPGFCTHGSSSVDTPVLQQDGIYTIVIDALNTGTGSITLTLTTLP